jgi:hypothetical protein
MYINMLPLLATVSVLIPATWRLVKNPTGIGLSLCACLSSALSMSAWLFYSIHQHLWISMVSSIPMVVYYIALLTVCVLNGGARDKLRPFYVLCAAVAVSLLGGMPALAIVLGLAPLAEAPQIRYALRGNVPALSTTSYGLVLLRTLPWLPYAIAHRDLALCIWVATCTMVNLSMFVVLVTTRSSRSSKAKRDLPVVPDLAFGSSGNHAADGSVMVSGLSSRLQTDDNTRITSVRVQ